VSLEDQRWRDLCLEAMRQNDINKLFNLFLELDRVKAREQQDQQRRVLRKPPETKRPSALEKHSDLE